MTKAFLIVGIVVAIFFISFFVSQMNSTLNSGITYSGGGLYQANEEELGFFGKMLDWVLPSTIANKIENGFGYIFGALFFQVNDVPTWVSFLVWALVLALIWLIVEIFRGV